MEILELCMVFRLPPFVAKIFQSATLPENSGTKKDGEPLASPIFSVFTLDPIGASIKN